MSKKRISLRDLCGLTMDERDAWSLILARSVRELNGRRLLGFNKLSRSKKKCRMCEKKAEISVAFDYIGRVYSLYFCKECFLEHFVKGMEEDLKEMVDHILTRIRDWVEED